MTLTPEIEAEGLALAEQIDRFASSAIRKAAAFIRASLAREKAADEAFAGIMADKDAAEAAYDSLFDVHDAFRREVSEAIYNYFQHSTIEDEKRLCRFILPPAPDPYEVKAREIVGEHEIWLAAPDNLVASIAAALREAKEGK